MSNIVAINGSPKAKDSVSGMIITQIEDIIKTPITMYQALKLIRQEGLSETLPDILKADTILFVFPLYVDSLPAPLVKIMTLIEQANTVKRARPPKVYAVCNCGFIEAGHTRLALDIMKNFCIRAGLAWGYGIGVGSGGFVLTQSKNMSKGKGPAANIYSAFCGLGESIQAAYVENGDAEKQNVFVTAKMPRFLYSLAGNLGWRLMAKKYGTGKVLDAKPHWI